MCVCICMPSDCGNLKLLFRNFHFITILQGLYCVLYIGMHIPITVTYLKFLHSNPADLPKGRARGSYMSCAQHGDAGASRPRCRRGWRKGDWKRCLLSIYQPIYLASCLCIYVSIHLSIHLSILDVFVYFLYWKAVLHYGSSGP